MRTTFSIVLTVLLLVSWSPLRAQAPAASDRYVIRVDSAGVYLDLGSKGGVTAGQPFTVFTKGEELKHPVTGASLGPLITELGHGSVFQVEEQYSVGRLEPGAGAVQSGQQYRLGQPPPPPAPPAAQQTPAQGAAQAEGVRAPYYRSPVLDLEAVDVAAGDVDGDGAEEAVLADKTRVLAYPVRQDAAKWAPICSYSDDRTGSNFLSVDAADLNGDGRAEVFAVLNNTFFQRVETLVLSCEKGGFVLKETVPGMVRSYALPEGGRGLAVQQLEPTPTFPLSNIYRLEFKDGHYVKSKDTIRYKRLGWVYGFGLAKIDIETAPVFYDDSDRIRVVLKKSPFATREKYGETANRVRWGEKLFHFRPKLWLNSGPEGLSGLYTLHNVAKYFTLASSFGLYDRAELHFLKWTGLGLEDYWKADIAGYAAGLSELHGPDGKGPGEADRLMVPVVGAGGRTSIWFFQK
jgi:hypothetical protein